MSKITVWFIKCAMVYFLISVVLGIKMAVLGATYPYIPIHVHFNLLGWMTMMIYGVGYHILPRFSGRPLYSDKMAEWQFWMANIGLVGMAIGWIVRTRQGDATLLMIFSIIAATAAFMFVLNMFKTIKAAPAPPAAK